MILKTIEETDRTIKYLKLKGWIEQPPLYKEVPPNLKEKISTIEAFNLWDHLTFRYDNIRSTQMYQGLVHDTDFKVIIALGLKRPKEQADMLEGEVTKYGIPIPKKPGIVSDIPTLACEMCSDDQIFRMIYIGLQGASIKHAQSLKNCTHCETIRNLFKKLFKSELDYIDDFNKYGKAKGWLNPVPTYG